MPLLLGQRAHSIHERKSRLEIGKLVAAHDVMLFDDIPVRRLRQLTMNVGEVFPFKRRHTAAAGNAGSACKRRCAQCAPLERNILIRDRRTARRHVLRLRRALVEVVAARRGRGRRSARTAGVVATATTSPRPPSRTRSLATTSVMYFFCPVCLSSRIAFASGLRYRPCRLFSDTHLQFPPAAARAPRCAFGAVLPLAVLPLKRSLVARVIFATGVPCGVCFTSDPCQVSNQDDFVYAFISAGSFADADFRDAHYIRSGRPKSVSPVQAICDESDGRGQQRTCSIRFLGKHLKQH